MIGPAAAQKLLPDITLPPRLADFGLTGDQVNERFGGDQRG